VLSYYLHGQGFVVATETQVVGLVANLNGFRERVRSCFQQDSAIRKRSRFRPPDVLERRATIVAATGLAGSSFASGLKQALR
jgi:hypothetical protein